MTGSCSPGTIDTYFFIHLKDTRMKLSKSLISAILIGIAIQTTLVSCGKDEQPKPQEKPKQTQALDGCPACGMG
jgi:hypothetical protein